MPESEHNGLRIIVVLALLFGAIWIIFSPVVEQGFAFVTGKPTPPLKQYDSLKRGIDMVGGSSLVYGIKKDPGALVNPNLASDVADALKLRVDPQSVKNLVWRPQGDSQLEIQMPASANATELADLRKKLREKMILAEEALKATNVDRDKVIEAIEHKEKDKDGISQADLPALASDSKVRQELFTKLKDLWNHMRAARQAGDAKNWARLQAEFQAQLARKPASANNETEMESAEESQTIESTNLPVEQLDGILRDTESQSEDTDPAKALKAKARAEEIDHIKKRFGVFPSRVKAIDDYVTAYIELATSQASLDDATDLKRLLKGAGVLEYHILAHDLMPPADYAKYVEKLRADGPRVHAGDEAKWFEVDPTRAGGMHVEEHNKKLYVLGYITPTSDGKPRSLDAHAGKPWHLTNATGTTNPQSAERVVNFTFDPQGAVYFGDLTEANIGRPMAIVLDDKIISAPVINSKISSNGQITGGKNGFTILEQDYLASTLKGGSLPAALTDEPISERTVGPQLGQANLHAGLIACLLGLVVVAVFLCGYYFTAGIVATCAVIMNVLLVLAVMSVLSATFTLPSIAGIVLSVGTAVDANVLIFERLREEQHRGLSLRLALRNAYGKAFSAILDSNMTTVITSFFLILFGTEEVKGFGVTLIIGIIASLFTALFVTRTVFSVMMEKFGVKNLRSIPLMFPRWDRALRPNIDWMGKAWIFISFSIIGITIGLVLFFIQVHNDKMMGIDFSSGTSVEFQLKNPMPQKDLQDLMETQVKKQNIDPKVLPAFNVVTVGNEGNLYEVVTPNPNAVEVRDALQKVLVDANGATLLKAEVRSNFEGSIEEKSQGAAPAAEAGMVLPDRIVIPLEEMRKSVTDVVPLIDKLTSEDAAKWPNRLPPPEAKAFSEGAAVILNQVDPPLTAEQITDRIKKQQEQLPDAAPAKRLEFKVISIGAKNASAGSSPTLAVLSSNKSTPYSKEKSKWEVSLAKPLKDLVESAINPSAANFQAAAWPKGHVPDEAKDYMPGVAIILNKLDPPLTAANIADRIHQRQLELRKGTKEQDLEGNLKFKVVTGTKEASSTAVILCRDDVLAYSADIPKWRENLAEPIWKLVNESINRPAQFQQVRNFDASVAKGARNDAILALVSSIIVIMAYIWFRFGNLKYGAATVVALLHDVLFTIAALGFAHYLWDVPGIGKLLMLDPFRIDLTVVAGILTIMGYSMIDTIVVFDRIRENRGKYGHESRTVINDAINQTLSRTLLTAGTNVVTVAIMYFVGGPGIHGFTFVLLIGILVGTYSSVAIAAPILLLGGHRVEERNKVGGAMRPARA